MEALQAGLYTIVEEDKPTTVRHVFYRAVAKGLVPKTEGAYKGVIVRLLTRMRRDGSLPYAWIADNTRWVMRSRTYRSPEEALAHMVATYRRDLWDCQHLRVEVWCEKDAVAGFLVDVADRWCVPTMVFRGYSSVSYLYALAEEIRAHGLPTFIYYFGDHDPSGRDIQRFVTETVRKMAPESDLHFSRLAVTREQIERYELPTRPTKKSDSRAHRFKGRSVELDALDRAVLQELCLRAITHHLDPDEVERLQANEKAERESFERFAARFGRKKHA